MIQFVSLILALGALSSNALARPLDSSEQLNTIAFGSCNFQRGATDHWDTIVEHKPQLWIWGGDNIYADHLWESQRRNEYNRLRNIPGYKRLREDAMVIGTWDDHDYAYNNAGKDYSKKQVTQRLLLDFLDEPQDSPRRKQEGVYASYVFGPAGRQVKVILLDLRYFRDKPGAESDILGDAQWNWLERELFLNSAQITLVVSSSQLIPKDHSGDKWAQYPQARKRVLALFDAFLIGGGRQLYVLSGDRHIAEVSRMELPSGHTLTEITSSGLTHSSPARASDNRYRVGELVSDRNFMIMKFDWEPRKPEASFKIFRNKEKPEAVSWE